MRDGGKVLASQRDHAEGRRRAADRDACCSTPGCAGPKNSADSRSIRCRAKRTRDNNAVTRLVNVDGAQAAHPLYGRRAALGVQIHPPRASKTTAACSLLSMLRTTQNKIYRAGLSDAASELEDGFPTKAEELFAFDGLIIGSVEANYFTPAQQELIREFVDRRGGGVLFLGGRVRAGRWRLAAFAAGRSAAGARCRTARTPSIAIPRPVELTAQGRDSLICRLEEDPERNVERWKKHAAAGQLSTRWASPSRARWRCSRCSAGGKRHLPLLVTQNYGRGRTAVFATGGSWRWQMLQDHDRQDPRDVLAAAAALAGDRYARAG